MAPSALVMWYLVGCFCNSVPWISARLVRSVNPPPGINMCMTETCRQSAEEIISKMDTAVDPCDNFYKFTCGKFLRENTPVPDHIRDVNAMNDATNKQVQNKMKEILEEASPPDELNAFKLVKKFYKACINKDANDEKGLSPVLDMLERLGSWPLFEGKNWVEDNFSWTEIAYKMNEAGYGSNYLIDLRITSVIGNHTKQQFLTLAQPFFPTIYFRDNKGFEAHLIYVVRVVEILLGVELNDDKLVEIREAVEFYWNLVYISGPLSANTRMTVTKLTQTYPTIPWKEFFQRMLPASIIVDENEVILVQNPQYMLYLEMLLSRTPKRVQANFLMYKIVLESIHYCSQNDNITQLNPGIMKSTVQADNMTHRHHWENCLDLILKTMPTSLAALYVRKNLKMDTRRSTSEMIEDITKQFKILLQNAVWMDDKAQKNALEKLDTMTSQIGYPDQLLDDNRVEEEYKGLVLDENDYFNSFLNMSHFRQEDAFKNLRVPVNESYTFVFRPNEYFNCFYLPERNRIYFQLGYLGTNYDNLSYRPKYLNYGNIGRKIGHEITHGFDDLGRFYDKNGKFTEQPWDTTTEKKFISKIQCLIQQYDNYTVEEVRRNVNGLLTLTENIADNSGVKAAYMAYKDWIAHNGPDPMLPGLPYSPTQMFWITLGSSWCTAYNKKALNQFINSNFHSPSEFRVIGPLSNMPEFGNDFYCPIGSKMNPVNKCTVW